MKKFLSLVLALVMTMSLVTISAGAEDFTDNSSIKYKEAVDVMSAVGVIDGYTDGSFQPTTNLTRGAAAKIICNLILGPTTASALGADTAPYSDVPTTNVFAGYIAYCQKEKIISGYADGTFRPSAPLTGYAFMKMLLGALGYDSAKEGYTGANWSVNVAKQALAIGLAKGNDEFVGQASVNREEAMLYAFNMMKADLVEYGNETTITVGDVSIETSGKAQSVKWGNSADKVNNIKQDEYVQFAERYFNKLVVRSTGDDLGRPANTWTWKGSKVGTYAKTATLTYYGDVKVYEIYNDLNMSTKDTGAKFYVNGVEFDNNEGTLTVSRTNEDKLSTLSDSVVGNGTVVEVFLNTDTNHVDICGISVYGGKISDVKEATSKKDAYVVVDPGSTSPAHFNDEFETVEFEEDDVVAYTYSDKTKAIQSMYKLESVEGALSKKVVGKSLTLGDTTYKYAKEVTFGGDLTSDASLTNKSEYVVYLDSQGNALWVEEAEFAVDAYALVLEYNSKGSSDYWTGNKADLLFADGTEKIVTLDKDYGTTIKKDTIVRFSVTDDGEYKLTNAKAGTFKKGAISSNNKVVTFAGASSWQYDSKTIFVVENGDDFDVYTGIRNVPNVTGGATGYVYARENVAKVVYMIGGTVTGGSKDITFIAGESVSGLVDEDSNTDLDYYVYNAVVKGEITTVMIDKNATGLTSGSKTNMIFNKVESDDGVITKVEQDETNMKIDNAAGVKKVSSDEIRLGTAGGNAGVIMAVSSKVNVYLIDVDGEIEEISMSDVKTNSDNLAYYTMEDGEITNLFIVEVED